MKTITPIAHIRTGFTDKFGIPRQSGIARVPGMIVFEEDFRDINAVRGIEQFSHLWLIWGFSEVPEEVTSGAGENFRATIRPPKLGGNERVGVFASRSPFRPNGLALSVVRLERVDTYSPDAPVLYVSGIDMTDNTPIYDIKPYVPYADSVEGATGGFSVDKESAEIPVVFPEEELMKVPEEDRGVLKAVLSQDPRPQYQKDPYRIYKMDYNGTKVSFIVNDNVLTVKEIQR